MGNICGGAILVGLGYWYIYLTPDSHNVSSNAQIDRKNTSSINIDNDDYAENAMKKQ